MFRPPPPAIASKHREREANVSTYDARPGPLPGTTLWRVTADEHDDELFRVIPDAVMDVVCFEGKLLFAGPDTSATLVPSSPGAVTWGLRFAPGIAHALLGVSAAEIADQRVELHELVRLDSAMLDAASLDPATALRQAVVELWMRVSPDAAALRLAHSVDQAARAGLSVRNMAELHGLSERTLRRFSDRVFGYGPKTLAAIHRLQRALRYARAGSSHGEAAALARYTDQSHLAREARRLTGTTFGMLTATR